MPNALSSRLLNLFFPPQCFGCDALVSREGALCSACWNAVPFIAAPMCARCGRPFDFALGGHAACGACLREPPVYAQARAVFRYDAGSKKLIAAYKYHDQTYRSGTYARWMRQAGAEIIPHCDAVVPVPLHKRRFLKRRYNQAALLAQAIAREENLAYWPGMLARVRATRPQAGLTRAQRRLNVRGAFRVPKKRKEALRGRNILLIDDVMTSGVTARQCSRALLRAGAGNVYVLTLARRV